MGYRFMKRKRFCLLPRLCRYRASRMPTLRLAHSSRHEKNTILKDLRKIIAPKARLTDEAGEKIMAARGTSSIFGRR